MSLAASILQIPLMTPLITTVAAGRCRDIVQDITPYLKQNDAIIDIGVGLGIVDNQLLNAGFTNITPLDVESMSVCLAVKPILYDGHHIPFKDKSFDVALIITVLHHLDHQEVLIREAARVAKKIILVEDIYSSRTEKHLTYILDSISNLEFIGHPHSNQTKEEWLKLFAKLRLSLTNLTQRRYWHYFTTATFVLEKQK